MGGVFRIDRVINNNVISVLEDGHEVILTGRGLGFGQHAGGTYEPARVERRFVLDDSRSAAGFTAMIAELPYEVIVLSNQIADYVEQEFGVWLSSARQLALADHQSGLHSRQVPRLRRRRHDQRVGRTRHLQVRGVG